MRSLACLSVLFFLPQSASAQVRHELGFAAAGVFPAGGYLSNQYSAGPGWRAGYELGVWKYLAAETGFTEAWPVGTDTCNQFGCAYSRQPLKFLDYGLRGIVPLAVGRVELSLGVGGGYVWHKYGHSGRFGTNQPLFQYSAQAAFALDPQHRFRAIVTVRAWRDLGRPTQQWISTTGGFEVGFGRLR